MSTEITKTQFNPLAPIGSAGGLKSLLEAQKNGISAMLPRHITPERLFKTMLVAANRNPDLLKCTQASLLETINRAAELGLDLSGTLGEAYPVPFNNKVKVNGAEQWMSQCQLIIGYRGYEKLAWQSGEVSSIDAEVVCENDTFRFKKGSEVVVEWTPCLTGKRGNAIGAYCCVTMKNGGRIARFLVKDDIEKIRNSSKSKDSPAWRNWWDEMARKCVIKRTLKDAPLSTEKLAKAMEIEHEADLLDVLDVEPTGHGQPAPRQQALADKLKTRQLPPAETAEEPAAVDQETGEVADEAPAGDKPAAPAITDYNSFRAACEGYAMDAGVGPADMERFIGAKLLASGKKGKEAELPSETLSRWFAEFSAPKA
jgi:recombination protein RecT